MDVKTDLEWVTNEIVTLLNKRFYGKLTITIDNGQIKHVAKETAMKPPSFFTEPKDSS